MIARQIWARRGFLASRRGFAAVEVALAFPMLLVVLGNLMDVGLMLRRHSQLSTGVANAAQYASLTGAGVSPATLQTIANASSWLNGATASASAAACYCPTGSPKMMGNALACTATCADGTVAQKYVTVTGTYTFSPLMPGLTGMAARTLTSSATVMVR